MCLILHAMVYEHSELLHTRQSVLDSPLFGAKTCLSAQSIADSLSYHHFTQMKCVSLSRARSLPGNRTNSTGLFGRPLLRDANFTMANFTFGAATGNTTATLRAAVMDRWVAACALKFAVWQL